MHRGWLLIGALTLGACDRVFGLDPHTRPDAPQQLPVDAPLDVILPANLVAWYPLDAIDGMATADVAMGNHAMCTDPTCPTAVPGRIGGALQFGNLSKVFAPGTPDLQTPDGFTVTAWLKVDATIAGTACPFNKIYGPNANSWQLCFGGGSTTFYTAAEDVVFNGTIDVGVWQLYAVRWDRMLQKGAIFRNGIKLSEKDVTLVLFDTGPVVIGADIDNGTPGSPFAGAIDDVRIYSRALTDAEILALVSGS